MAKLTSTLRANRVRRAAVIALGAVLTTGLAGGCASDSESTQAHYCALMPDSVGLYVGNPVTQMGYPIGEVKAITPNALDVQVDFTLKETRRLPADVKAIIRSPSLLADRSLELVGNYESGPQLVPGSCVPLSRSSTPKSLSEVIGSAATFVNSINPDGSSNIGDVVTQADQAMRDNGAAVNQLLTTSSAVLEGSDEAINDMGSIVTNLGRLTSVIRDLRGPLKELLYNAVATMPDVNAAVDGGGRVMDGLIWLTPLVTDLEVELGEEIQFTLDATSVALRKADAHAPWLADLLNPVPWWINTAANKLNNRHFDPIRYRPPLYRIQTPDGVALCNIMNASMPNSCANVQGHPVAVDVALLQYVFSAAANR